MTTGTVVVDLDVFEDRVCEFQPGPPLLPVEQLHLHRSPEGFDHGVVIPIPNGSHRPNKAGITDSAGEKAQDVNWVPWSE